MSSGTKKGQRHHQFAAHGSLQGMSFAQQLIVPVADLLRLSLEERAGNVRRLAFNHVTTYAPAIVVLSATSFHVWLTECTMSLRTFDPSAPSIATDATCTQYVKLMNHLGSQTPANEVALRSLIDVRDEVVHYLPRVLPGGVKPDWLDVLDKKGLLLDYAEISLQISSYALAHWACSTVASCAREVVGALPPEWAMAAGGWTAKAFEFFDSIPGPDRLGAFDASRGLELTRAPSEQ